MKLLLTVVFCLTLFSCSKDESTIVESVVSEMSDKSSSRTRTKSIPVNCGGYLIISTPHSLSDSEPKIGDLLGKKKAKQLADLEDMHDIYKVVLITNSGKIIQRNYESGNTVFNGAILLKLNPGGNIELKITDDFLEVVDSVVVRN